MAEWHDFYLLAGTGSATLTGLMFIAVTFGARLVTPETIERARAFLYPMFTHLVHSFLLCCLALVPTQSTALLGAASVVTAVCRLFALTGIYKQVKAAQLDETRPGEIHLSDWLLDIVSPILIYSLLIASGIGLIRGHSFSPMGLAVAVLALLLVGMWSAWDLLVWMATKL